MIERQAYFDIIAKLSAPDPTPLGTAWVPSGSASPGIHAMFTKLPDNTSHAHFDVLYVATKNLMFINSIVL